jgi:chemotaxis signal transduction protein
MSKKSATDSVLTLRKDTPGVAHLEMCSVRVGDTFFGVPITHILEIVGNTRPRSVPLAPEFVGGLIHYRGDVLTTVSLRDQGRQAGSSRHSSFGKLRGLLWPAGRFGRRGSHRFFGRS